MGTIDFFSFCQLFVIFILNHVVSIASSRPNLVVFLADDLGIGDVGCFGNTTLKTPNVDYLCKHGVKLQHNLAAESICTPSRGAFMTGRYAVRSGLGSGHEIRTLITNSGTGGLSSNETTFARILRDNGYQTWLVGKWHLGLSCGSKTDFCHHPLNHGFQHFYGLPLTNMRDCVEGYSNTVILFSLSWFNIRYPVLYTSLFVLAISFVLGKKVNQYFPLHIFILLCLALSIGCFVYQFLFKRDVCILMRNFTVVEQPVFHNDLTQRFVSEAVHLIDKHGQDKPFLLVFAFSKVHTALFTTEQFKNHSVHGKYGDNVEEMDWALGAVVAALQRNSYLNNTMIYFSSDHGPHLEEVSENGEYHGGSKSHYKGGKGTSWEGGIRVPTVAMWQGVFPPGRVVTEPTSSLDVFTTFVRLAGAEVPRDRYIDGKNIFELLNGQVNTTPHDFIFHYCGTSLHAVTYILRSSETSVWKLHLKTPIFSPGTDSCASGYATCLCHGKYVRDHEPPLLYALDSSPDEKTPEDPNSVTFEEVVNKVKIAVINHEKTVQPVCNQLNSYFMHIARFHCCNYPFCSCKENYPYDMLPVNTSLQLD